MHHAGDLPNGVRNWLMTYSPKWGDINVSDQFDDATRASCTLAIRQAFNDTFNLLAWICCALTAFASLMTVGFVGCPQTDPTAIEVLQETKLGLNEC